MSENPICSLWYRQVGWKMVGAFHYDVAVIGAGIGGYAAAQLEKIQSYSPSQVTITILSSIEEARNTNIEEALKRRNKELIR